MAFTGGDLDEIVCSHPTLGTLRFQPKSNESFNIDRGGIRTNDDANQITSSGSMIQQKNKVRWMVEGPIAVDYPEDTVTENLGALSASPVLGEWTFTMLSGLILKGTGNIVGDIVPDANTATLTIKVSGGGVLEKIS